MSTSVIIGGTYRHYKGELYTVLAVARNEANPEEQVVVYRAEYESPDFGVGQVWIRKLERFLEMVEVDGKETPCFEHVP
jgi:hypothetical protein